MGIWQKKPVAAKLLCLLLAVQLCASPVLSDAQDIISGKALAEADEGTGKVVDTDVDVNAAATLRILANPVDFTGEIGETVTMFVFASGDDLAYQWQYS